MAPDDYYKMQELDRDISMAQMQCGSLKKECDFITELLEPAQVDYDQVASEIREDEKHYRKLYNIAKNRANADREIRPKREKSGFRVLRLREDTLRAGRTTVPAIRLIIQTPYIEELTLEEVHALWDVNGIFELEKGLGVELLKMGDKIERNSKIKRPYFAEFDLQPSLDPQRKSYWNVIAWSQIAPKRYE